jgi:DNA polymerase III epsilon subunit
MRGHRGGFRGKFPGDIPGNLPGRPTDGPDGNVGGTAGREPYGNSDGKGVDKGGIKPWDRLGKSTPGGVIPREHLALRRVIVLDIETTGLAPEEGHRILEITALPVEGERLLMERRFDRLVNPNMPIPPGATLINGISDEMVRDADPIEKVLPEFLTYIEGFPLVAHNACFDLHFIRYYARSLHAGEVPNPVIDTLEMSRSLFHRYRRHNLDTLLRRLGIPFDPDKRHRSLEDTRLTALAYLKMRGLIVSAEG